LSLAPLCPFSIGRELQNFSSREIIVVMDFADVSVGVYRDAPDKSAIFTSEMFNADLAEPFLIACDSRCANQIATRSQLAFLNIVNPIP
jgi:hypothetical protein